jgi:hypothetical protein
MDIRIKPGPALEAMVRDFMILHGVSATMAVRLMLGDPSALRRDGDLASSRDADEIIRSATPVELSVFDRIPPTFGRPGYVATVVRYMIVALNVGDAILIKSFTDRVGRQVPASSVSVHINKTYKNGTFSILTKGLPKGQYIIRRNA